MSWTRRTRARWRCGSRPRACAIRTCTWCAASGRCRRRSCSGTRAPAWCAVGDGRDDLEVGDHVVLSWVPQCGACRQCRDGRPWQCEVVANVVAPGGVLLDGTSRWGDGFHHYLGVSAFAERVVVPRSGAVKIRKDVPLDVVAIVGCAVATGRRRRAQHGGGAAGRDGRRDRLRRRRAVGDPGRAAAQASRIVACDLNPAKLEVAKRVGATETVADAAELSDLDYVFDAIGQIATTEAAIGALALGGAAVIVGLPPAGQTARFDPLALAEANQRILGSNYGSIDPQHEIPWIIDLYKAGELDLDSLISGRRPLEQAAEALEDLAAGRTLRTLLTMEDGGL